MLSFGQAAAILTYGMSVLSGFLTIAFAFIAGMNQFLPTGYRAKEPAIFPAWLLAIFSGIGAWMWWMVGDYLWKVSTTGAG